MARDHQHYSGEPAIILLAAGNSSRMGEPKQLLEIGGKSLVYRAAETAIRTGWKPVIVVTGAYPAEIEKVLAGLELDLVNNPDWRSGMAGSIKTGLNRALQIDPALEAAVLMVCDQPHVTPDLLQQLLLTRRVSSEPVVASAYGEALGTPALFDRAVFPQLLALEGEAGAKKLIRALGSRIAQVDFPQGEIDIDTPADYTNFRQQHNE